MQGMGKSLILNGGEGGILLPPLPASHCETYSSVIIPCVCAGYKQIRSQAGVSIVSLIRCHSRENGISSISAESGKARREEEATGGKDSRAVMALAVPVLVPRSAFNVLHATGGTGPHWNRELSSINPK